MRRRTRHFIHPVRVLLCLCFEPPAPAPAPEPLADTESVSSVIIATGCYVWGACCVPMAEERTTAAGGDNLVGLGRRKRSPTNSGGFPEVRACLQELCELGRGRKSFAGVSGESWCVWNRGRTGLRRQVGAQLTRVRFGISVCRDNAVCGYYPWGLITDGMIFMLWRVRRHSVSLRLIRDESSILRFTLPGQLPMLSMYFS